MARLKTLLKKIFIVALLVLSAIFVWNSTKETGKFHRYVKAEDADQSNWNSDDDIQNYDESYERTNVTIDILMNYNQQSISNTTSRYALIDIDKHMPDVDYLFSRTAVVTAVSSNHFDEIKGMIASSQRRMPQTKIVAYDLGLTPEQAAKMKTMCNVDLRQFDFKKYPRHVKNLHTYAWKPLIIKETLTEFGSIFYGDSSVRFRRSLSFLFQFLKENHGFMQHIHSFNPRLKEAQYYMTHPKTFLELKVKRDRYKNDIGYTPWISAGRVLYVNNSFLHENIITPMVDCALRPQCISPEGAHRGWKPPNGSNHPHRFDSSVLSLLVYKNMRGFYNGLHNSTQEFDKTVRIARDFKDISAGVKTLQFEPNCRHREKRQAQCDC
ncbi:uncharacterized protein [Amphiura filiformis]|uniref:uncharacterized protein n=1 Tax=Amphiura filiformis TaxID=82378 RepID=UPI003B2165E9